MAAFANSLSGAGSPISPGTFAVGELMSVQKYHFARLC
jgi:hypothetical protein